MPTWCTYHQRRDDYGLIVVAQRDLTADLRTRARYHPSLWKVLRVEQRPQTPAIPAPPGFPPYPARTYDLLVDADFDTICFLTIQLRPLGWLIWDLPRLIRNNLMLRTSYGETMAGW